MKVLVMIGNSMIGKYCAGQFVNNLNVCGIIVENKKVNKFKSIKKKLKKNPFLFPYKFVEAGIISFYNRIISKKINNYFKDIKLDSYNVKNINSKDVQKIITSLKPDIGIIVGTSILKNKIISLFPKGVLNLHTGLLPKYRGLKSEFWAIYNNDFENVGSTIIKIDSGIDTGGILLRNKLNIKNLKVDEALIHCKNVELGAKLMIDSINNFDKLKVEKQGLGNYYTNPSLIQLVLYKLNKIFGR